MLFRCLLITLITVSFAPRMQATPVDARGMLILSVGLLDEGAVKLYHNKRIDDFWVDSVTEELWCILSACTHNSVVLLCVYMKKRN